MGLGGVCGPHTPHPSLLNSERSRRFTFVKKKKREMNIGHIHYRSSILYHIPCQFQLLGIQRRQKHPGTQKTLFNHWPHPNPLSSSSSVPSSPSFSASALLFPQQSHPHASFASSTFPLRSVVMLGMVWVPQQSIRLALDPPLLVLELRFAWVLERCHFLRAH